MDGTMIKIGIEQTQIVVGNDPPELDLFAAKELQRYFYLLSGVNVRVESTATNKNPLIIIGNPTTNSNYRALGLNNNWPDVNVTTQGIVLKSLMDHDRPTWLIGGGSPVATLWAVYEFVEQLGIRFLLSGDVLPDTDEPPILPKLDHHMEPALHERIWRVMNDEPHGPEMWSLNECQRVIDQLTKMKINGIYFNTYPSHPFVHYEFRGVKKTTATLDFGFKYPVDNETVGRDIFGDAKEFINPEFQHCDTYDEWVQAGQKYAHSVFKYAKSKGMKVGMGFSLIDVPTEFKVRFHEWETDKHKTKQDSGPVYFSRMGVVTVGTPPNSNGFQDVNNPALLELSELIVKSHVQTYPELDFITVSPAEHRAPVTGYRKCWKALNKKYGVESIAKLDLIVENARSRHFHNKGRAEQELKSDIEFLYFLDKLFKEVHLLEKLNRPNLQVILSNMTKELYPILEAVLPDGFGFKSNLEYNLTLATQHMDSLDTIQNAKFNKYLNMSIQDDMNSLLIASEGTRITKFLEAICRYGFTGWISRYWSIGDLDHSTLFLTRASWNPDITPNEVYRDYICNVYGPQCLPEMLEAFRLLEENSAFQSENIFAVGFPYPNLMRGHFEMDTHFSGNSKPRDDLLKCKDNYVRMGTLAESAFGKSRHNGKSSLKYFIGRLKTCAMFLDTAYIVEKAGIAYRSGQKARENSDPFEAADRIDEASTLLKQSVVLAQKTIEAHIEIVRDESDVGLLAAMNEYMYKYLKAKSYIVHNESIKWRL